MKRLVTITIVIVGGLIAGLALVQPTTTPAAAQQVPLMPEHRQRIIDNCDAARASLRQLHRNDISSRFNQGRLYEFITTKLMARMNSRLSLNRMGDAHMVTTTNSFDKELSHFREVYGGYISQLDQVLRIDCTKNPDNFYYGVVNAREKRQDVQQSIGQLNTFAGEYYGQFQQFSNDFNEERI